MSCMVEAPRQLGESYAEIQRKLAPILTRLQQLRELNPSEVDYALGDVARLIEAASGQLEALQEALTDG